MTQEHPIIPPPELIRKWNEEAANTPMADQRYIATQAARWGAEQSWKRAVSTSAGGLQLPNTVLPNSALLAAPSRRA